MRITIPDDLYECYQRTVEGTSLTPEERMVGLLTELHRLPVQDRVLVLSGAERAQIEKLTGSYTRTAEELVEAIARLAVLKIGKVQVDFLPKQWEEIKHRADREGVKVQVLVERIVREMSRQFFNYC